MESFRSIDELRQRLAPVETVAIVCSQLGRSGEGQRRRCRWLTRSLMDCRSRGATLIVACESAIEPWAIRGAEIFGVPMIRIGFGRSAPNADYLLESVAANRRDATVIDLANRVDAVYVRRGGRIAASLADRVGRSAPGFTRVAISPDRTCAATELIAMGAIGWFDRSTEPPTNRLAGHRPDWTIAPWGRTDGEWLVHCTRGPQTCWPGETERQYRDSILLGASDRSRRQPIDTLCRIIRSGKLIAAATATHHDHPVVCFSAVPLATLLERRCFRPQLGRWDYEPYGVGIRRRAAEIAGIQPVIYGDPQRRATLAPEQRFRFHPVGKTFDWTSEREWRSPKSLDLHQFNDTDVRIFAADNTESRSRLAECHWRVSFIPQTVESCV